ncbi:MAG: class C sortase [Lachnospiraceae bacterium]|nr:class C sortase [Lachnospiraceae bacterium]
MSDHDRSDSRGRRFARACGGQPGGMRALLTAACVVIGCAILLYPYTMAATTDTEGCLRAARYEEACGKMAVDETRQVLSSAREYNKALADHQKSVPYRYQGEMATDEAYEAELGGQDIMAVLDIPAINVHVPVVHGTGSHDLLTAAGHFFGTSLPIGGLSSHAGIAAHAALSTARLFTDLEKLTEGDMFSLTVMGECLTYEVVSTIVVLPEEADDYLQIEEGKDLVTLYTCTPYGINSHRLLVKGERLPDREADKTVATGAVREVRKRQGQMLVIAVLMAAAAFLPAVCLSWRRRGNNITYVNCADNGDNSGSGDRRRVCKRQRIGKGTT